VVEYERSEDSREVSDEGAGKTKVKGSDNGGCGSGDSNLAGGSICNGAVGAVGAVKVASWRSSFSTRGTPTERGSSRRLWENDDACPASVFGFSGTDFSTGVCEGAAGES
jgi:hypothetical protein